MDTLADRPQSQALVVIGSGPVHSGPIARSIRPESGFLAQIIASDIGVMQYRARRRETPDYAMAAYARAGSPGLNIVSIAA
jgi:hypothetical protein